MIAVCDHNSARNAAATQRAAAGTGVTVIAGMEITSSEEVHIVGLFPTAVEAEAVQDEIYARLPGENDEDVFGYQVVVDEHDMVEDMDGRLLIGATTIQAEAVVDLIHRHGGIAIASHVDRESFGIFGQLGFIPDSLKFDALEISRHTDRETVRRMYPQTAGYTLIRSSDAHHPADIGSVMTEAIMAEPSFDELKKALAGLDGRGVPDA